MCIGLPFFAWSQSDIDLYQDFTGDSTSPEPSFNLSSMFDGEYQWIYPEDSLFPWLGLSPFEDLFYSYKIEAVSFPFVPDTALTYAAPTTTRILNCPTSYDAITKEWDVFTGTKRISQGEVQRTPYSDVKIINSPSTLVSNFFTVLGPPGSGREFLPHTVLRHTLYAHAGSLESSSLVDSISFIVDNTRAAMRFYPFVNGNANTGTTSSESTHDVLIYSDIILPSTNGDSTNTIGSANYYTQTTACFPIVVGSDTLCFSEEAGCLPASADPFDFLHPSPYSFLRVRQLSYRGNYPIGYIKPSATLEPVGGVKHQYVIDENIDVSTINPIEKIIYNPILVRIEADSLVFPTGYTFSNAPGKYPLESTVENSPICNESNVAVPYVQVPSTLDTALYILEDDSKLYIDPCVYLYDLIIRVDTGSTLTYYPDATYGNFLINDNGGTIDTLPYNGFCNNCRCVQEHTVSSTTYINSNTTYNAGCIVNGLIVVNPGNLLTIRNCTVEFTDSERVGKRSGIIVRPGGKLRIDNAELTSLACDKLWDGIQVEGDPSLLSPLFDKDDQGSVKIINGGKISNARVGIYAGGFCPDGVVCPDDAFQAGGYVEVDSAIFENNIIGIKFAPYARKNLSYIENTTFATTRRIGSVLSRKHRIEHILLDEKAGLPISNCTFINEVPENYPIDSRGTGIVSLNGRFEANDCSFTALTKGVDAYNFGSISRRMFLNGNTFNAIPMAVTGRGGYLNYIVGNRFNATTISGIDVSGGPPMPFEDTTYSIYLIGSQMFEVSNNTFMIDTADPGNGSVSEFPYGIAISNSSLGGGSSFGNNISEQAIGVQTERDNRNLLLRCDTFSSQFNSDYRINPVDADPFGGLDTLPDFGVECIPGGTAGNIFAGSSGYNIRQEAGNTLIYHASGFSISTLPEDNNIDSIANCDFTEPDVGHCPESIECWLVDCPPGSWFPDLDTLVGEIDTFSPPSPLRMAAVKDVVQHAVFELDSIELAIDFLEHDSTLFSIRMQLPYRLEQSALNQASNALNQIDQWTGTPYDTTENDDYVSFYSVVHDALDNGNSLHELTGTEISTIVSIANAPNSSSALAQSVLAKVEGKRYFDVPDSESATQPRWNNSIENRDEATILVYPNPSSGSIRIESTVKIEYLILHSMSGTTTTELLNGQRRVQISTDLPTGMYVLELMLAGGVTETHKIIIQR
jgi:hypothetical protein